MFDLAKLFINRAVCWVESGFLSQKKRNFASSKNQKFLVMKTKTKVISITSVVLLLALAGFFYFRFYFPLADDGVKAGQLNYFVHKGIIFKTYEGKIIQSGLKSKTAGTLESNEFKFSVEDEAVADSLMHCSGKWVELHYKEYFAPLPWRGVSNYIVDGIVRVSEAEGMR